MLSTTSLTKGSTSRKRDLSRLLVVVAVLGLTVLCDSELKAQPAPTACTTVGYLQQLPIGFPRSSSRQPTYGIPFDPSNGSVSPTWTGAGTYYFNLPGYGAVSATVSPYPGNIAPGLANYVPKLTWGLGPQLKSTSGNVTCSPPATYKWGTDTNYLHLANVANANQPQTGETSYTITFGFTALLPPDPSDLFLVVYALASDSSATLHPPANAGPPSLGLSLGAGCNAGEFTVPKSPSYPGGPTSTTYVPTASTNYTVSSLLDGDPYNTGWDLYQLKSPSLRQLTLGVTHTPGDGLGFSLGYCVCSTLVGNSLDSRDGNIRHLYDINPLTGAATNPRIIGPNWDLAFSPMSPEGTLYALVQNLGAPVPNALFTVNPLNGTATEVASLAPLVFRGGALAADPTTGILYAVDGAGNLFTVTNTGVWTRIGRGVPGAIQISAMALDNSGDLFMVDTGTLTGTLLKVDKSTANVISSSPLSSRNRITGFAALAIDPWSGIAYYSEGGLLYKLNLSNGALSSPVPITGAEDFGNLASLTFTMGAACK